MRRIKESRSFYATLVAIVGIVATLIVVWLVVQASGESRVLMAPDSMEVQHKVP